MIGPNAKQAYTSGGGSARLLSTYTVSPLEGITAAAKEFGAEITYGIGATSHKYLPLLDGFMQLEDGKSGALVEFWNENPSGDFLTANADVKGKVNPSVWSTTTSSSNCFLMDGIVSLASMVSNVQLICSWVLG